MACNIQDSCSKLGVCCKATMLSSHALGPSAPEGSDEFRFRVIAMKPAFLLDQLEKTQQVSMRADLSRPEKDSLKQKIAC